MADHTRMYSYHEARPLLYSSNTFTFRDPYAVMFWSLRLPRMWLKDVRKMYLHLSFRHSPSHFQPEEHKLWTELWSALQQFGKLQELCVSMVQGPPCPVEHFTADLTWLEPLKRISAPELYQLMLPVDTARLQMTMLPSNCEVLGHPWFTSLPASLKDRELRYQWLSEHGRL